MLSDSILLGHIVELFLLEESVRATVVQGTYYIMYKFDNSAARCDLL